MNEYALRVLNGPTFFVFARDGSSALDKGCLVTGRPRGDIHLHMIQPCSDPDARIAALEKELQRLHNLLETVEQNLFSVEKANASVTRENTELKKHNAVLEEALLSNARELFTYTTGQYADKLKESEKYRENLIKDRETLINRVAERDMELCKLKADLSKASDDLYAARAVQAPHAVLAIKAELERVRGLYYATKDSWMNVCGRYDQAQIEIAELEDEARNLRELLAKTKDQLNAANKNIESLTQTVRDLNELRKYRRTEF